MITPAKNISNENFKKMLAGSKGYLPTKVIKGLKKAGLADLLHKKSVNRQQALKAIRQLNQQGLVSKAKAPSQFWSQNAIKQASQDLAVAEVKKQRHIRAYIAEEVSETLRAEDRGEETMNYDPRSELGKNQERLMETINREKSQRDKKVSDEQSKRNQLYKNKNVKPQKPPLVDLPTLDIG